MVIFNKIFGKLLEKLPENNRLERLWKLAQVDFRKRYYHDSLGVLWALINPILRVSIYYLIFTYVLGRVREGIDNFALFLFAALIFWMLFTEIFKKSMRLIMQKRYLIQNIKISVIDLYLANGMSTLFGFIFNLFAFIIITLIVGTSYDARIFLLIPLVINTWLIGMGAGMILSIAYILFSDINHLVDILVMLGFWTSGIFFPSQIILEKYPTLYYLNPFLGIFQNVRSISIYNTAINYEIMIVNFSMGVVVYIIGFILLKKYYHLGMEKL